MFRFLNQTSNHRKAQTFSCSLQLIKASPSLKYTAQNNSHLLPLHLQTPNPRMATSSQSADDAAYKILIESQVDHEDDDDDDECTDESHFIYVLNMILSGTARLNVLLPTATILAFTIFTPLLTNEQGKCEPINRYLMAAFIALCAASCVFFAFTDSFRAPSGRLYYGIATISGIWTFNGRRRRPPQPERYRLRWGDVFHAVLSLVAFGAFAGSHHDVVGCYYPAVPRKVTSVAPLVVGFVISVLFVVFPSKRRGIGYPFLLQRDVAYYRR